MNMHADRVLPLIPPDTVIEAVCAFRGYSDFALRGRSKGRALAHVRFEAMYMLREFTQLSTTEIGLRFGGRDHTTVLHAVTSIEDRIARDPAYREKMKALRAQITTWRATRVSALQLGVMGLNAYPVSEGEDVRALAVTVVACAGIARDEHLTDADARRAILQLLETVQGYRPRESGHG
jgi:hypothetical protein